MDLVVEIPTQVHQKSDGRVKKGEIRNPKGRPPAGQGLKDRLAWWLESKTVDEIENLITDKKKWGKLVAADAHCCMVVAEGCKKTGLSAVQFIFDRLLGKAPQAITGEDGKPLLREFDQMEIARRAAFLLATVLTPAIEQPAQQARLPDPALKS